MEAAAQATADHLRAERARRNLKQSDLAEKTGLSHYTIARLENGKQDMKLEHIILISMAFGITPGQFLDDARAHMSEQAARRDA